MKWLTNALAASVLLVTPLAQAASELVLEGLKSPWGIEFINADQALVTEKNGGLKLVDIKAKTQQSISGLPAIKANGQGGLMDVALSPNFADDQSIYFTYARKTGDEWHTALAKGIWQDNKINEFSNLLVTISGNQSGRHFGSRIAFDDAGHVFFTVGDRGHRPNGQDLMTHAGSIIRLNLDGSIPVDNPFVNRDDALPEIYSYGHRNPQGIVFDTQSKQLWAIEHGPRGGDEINLVEAGLNYGWPVISYGEEYYGPFKVGESTHKEGMEQPAKYYIPSIAPSSLILHDGFLYAGALAKQHINKVAVNGSKLGEETRLFEQDKQRVRDLTAHQGMIYFVTDDGDLKRFKP